MTGVHDWCAIMTDVQTRMAGVQTRMAGVQTHGWCA